MSEWIEQKAFETNEKLIKLTRGLTTVVSSSDYLLVLKRKWQAATAYGTYYAVRTEQRNNVRRRITLHGFLLKPPKGLFVDHINGDGLDNRRSNLRIVTRAQNQQNRRVRYKKTSSYKGISYNKNNGMWTVSITHEGETLICGSFANEIQAAMHYDKFAIRLFKDYACLNFPGEPENG